ncbi:MAG: putative 27 kDa outer membrane protein [Micavibrio sp.]|nr:putative 27 kDa outer membrane protein [Micavibrio sp.]
MSLIKINIKTKIPATVVPNESEFPVNRKILSVAIAALLVSVAPVSAHAADAPVFTEAQKKQLDTMFHDYIMNNPKTIMDSVEKFRTEQQASEEKNFDVKVKEKSDELYKKAADPVAGDKTGDVTLVEFFDYNCGYCKHAFKDLKTLMETDKKLRVVFKDIPILSETSFTAAQYALAANKQGKYWEFHTAMMEHNGPISEESLQAVGKSVGLDVEKLKKDSKDPEIRAQIESNLALSRDIGVNGTPAFVINDTVLRGAYGLEAMQKAVADSRKK